MRRVCAAALLAGALPALAQVPPDAGRLLRDLDKPPPVLPAKPPPAPAVEQPERPALAPQPVRFTLRALRITGNTVFAESELAAHAREQLGNDVGFAQLQDAAARITRFYRERGYPVARAYLPAQEIRGGVVEIAVLEGRFGKLELNNRSRVADEVIARHFEAAAGALIEEGTLERRLLLVNDLAGVDAQHAALRPGTRVGESDVALSLGQSPRARGAVELDNYGTYSTGEWRISGELGVPSPAGRGDLLSMRFTQNLPGLEQGRIAYQLPIGASGLRAYASLGALRYRLGKNFESLDASGTATDANASLAYPFVRTRTRNVYGRIGYARRDFADELNGGTTRTEKATDVATAAVSGDWLDALGGGGVNAYSLAYAYGALDIQSPAALAIDDATVRTQGSFGKWTMSFLRLQRATGRLSLYGALSAQRASKNLDSSEKFSLGGPFGVRAYPLGEGAGDDGYLLNAELRWDIQPARLQAVAFYDEGTVWGNHDPLPSASGNKRRLNGAGGGVNWAWRDTSLRAMVATRLTTDAATAAPERNPRFWLQLVQRL